MLSYRLKVSSPYSPENVLIPTKSENLKEPPPLQDGCLADGLSQVALSGAAGTEKQGVFPAIDEAAGGKIEDQTAVHLGVEGEVEVV